MSALVRRHRMWVAVFACALLVGVGWVWITHLSAADTPKEVSKEAADAAKLAEAMAAEDRALAVDANLNANTRSIAEAKKSGKNPERFSAMIQPKSFDRAAFERDPQAYLDVVEPGRVFLTAKPSMEVKQLLAKGSSSVTMPAGGSVELVVVGEPGGPVSFTAFDGGIFENKLNSITVRCDEKGEAKVTYTATRGTVAHARIVAGSPLASDQVHFQLYVEEPQDTSVDRKARARQ